MPTLDIEELPRKKICYDCIGESYLKEEVKTNGKRLKCSYCGEVARCYFLEQLCERIETAFSQFYVRTPENPDEFETAMLIHNEIGEVWLRDGSPVVYAIMDAAGISEQAAKEIQEILEDNNYDKGDAECGLENEFATDSYYFEKAANAEYWQKEWDEFENSLKTKSRFFNEKAERHLKSVFKGIADMKTYQGMPVILMAGPGSEITELYRARVFQSNEKLEAALFQPDQQLGAPPSNLAKAGRMNSTGISMFYGSNEPTVALAEVRPPVGSKVAIARFEIIRPLKLIDLTALESVSINGSIFDPHFSVQTERNAFLRNLSKRLIVPVMPDDENFDYLPTQAIADFLAMASKPKLDGIIFNSVQVNNGGKNITLFNHASKVRNIKRSENSSFDLRYPSTSDEYYDPDYLVLEEIAEYEKAEIKPRNQPHFDSALDKIINKQVPTKPALKIDLDSIKVHLVKGVNFGTDEASVRRHRFERRTFEDTPILEY